MLIERVVVSPIAIPTRPRGGDLSNLYKYYTFIIVAPLIPDNDTRPGVVGEGKGLGAGRLS